jgi:hypothetical protein
MCLQIIRRTKREPKPRIAKRNIIIYKVVEEVKKGIYFSPYYDFQYKLGKKNKRIELEPQYAYTILSTISSLRTGNLHFYEVYKGYHAYRTLQAAKYAKEKMNFANNPVILKGIVPQGEKYLTNNKDEIVASNIILTKELK